MRGDMEMRIGTFSEYRGTTGSIEYSSEDKLHYGELLVSNGLTISYCAKTIEELYKKFCKSVDYYFMFKS
jgi:predicted HicB family RNase H-like nuclease